MKLKRASLSGFPAPRSSRHEQRKHVAQCRRGAREDVVVSGGDASGYTSSKQGKAKAVCSKRDRRAVAMMYLDDGAEIW